MATIKQIVDEINKLIHEGGVNKFNLISLQNINLNQINCDDNSFVHIISFLKKLIKEIDALTDEIKKNESTLISVNHQKILRTCFQIITSLGISPSLIPGLGLSLTKRSSLSFVLPSRSWKDEDKYCTLVTCTDFFTRCYKVPVFKNIIISLHLSDYLACLIQLSFAPFKKPGNYGEYTMTEEMYTKLMIDKQKYLKIYEDLVINCFQPVLMKELLVLQSVTNPPPPTFVKKTIAKELSQRLLASGGLLSLIRCFIENYGLDTGFEWKKVDMIGKIVATKHGSLSEEDYLINICTQLKHMLSLNNIHYLATVAACVLSLKDKFPHSVSVKSIEAKIFNTFDYDLLTESSSMPGSLLLSSKEIEHNINILHASICTIKFEKPINISSNIFLLFQLGMKCTRNEELKIKIKDIILKYLEHAEILDLDNLIKLFLFGCQKTRQCYLIVEEYNSGLGIKVTSEAENYEFNEALVYFIELFKSSENLRFIESILNSSLQMLIDISKRRSSLSNSKHLLMLEEEPEILDKEDLKYLNVLQLLSEISTSPKVTIILKENPNIVLPFIENFIINHENSNEECVTIALVLLNNILASGKYVDKKLLILIPTLKELSSKTNINSIICKEALTVILSGKYKESNTPCSKALANVFDTILPVRAHGIMELTKLIDSKDVETLSKKHLIFCLLQEQLKDEDTYIYLSAINCMSALVTHCTEDVLHVLCSEFLQSSLKSKELVTNNVQNQVIELRLKIGDALVKSTKQLGEMAIVHRTILLNTILSGCRDEDPFIRTSALSNLAEIAQVLHYKMGPIIYEILLCIWSTIETDKAIECRRAAVMVISSLFKGLGKDNLMELKENLLPIYRALKKLYSDDEDDVLRLHAQIALEELNDIVNQLLFPELTMEKKLFVIDQTENVFK